MINKTNTKDILAGACDLIWRDIKSKSKPAVLHQKTCPICGSQRVNVYYSNQLDKYICKKCMDKPTSAKQEV